MSRGLSLHIGLNEVDPNHYRDGNGNPWKGELAACENDAHSMAELAAGQGFDVRPLLLSAQAKADAVAGEIRSAGESLQPGDIFLLTYSGHGGQVANMNPEVDPEDDNFDETWCLYDREFIDDELFALFSAFRPGVRIVVLSDSCHSGTVSRGDPPRAGEEIGAPKQLPMDVAEATERDHADLYAQVQRDIPAQALNTMLATVVLLSGCQDDEFSRDGRVNGAFTEALLKAWQDPNARRSLPELAKAAGDLIPTRLQQHPNYSIYSFDVSPAITI
jgi:hypothetical protein